jgi:hypothetical protein
MSHTRYETFEQIEAWIEEHVKIEPESTPKDKAIWFCCYERAEEMRDSYGAKDWAFEVFSGMQPMRTQETCTAWLLETQAEWLEYQLKEHFGRAQLKS